MEDLNGKASYILPSLVFVDFFGNFCDFSCRPNFCGIFIRACKRSCSEANLSILLLQEYLSCLLPFIFLNNKLDIFEPKI